MRKDDLARASSLVQAKHVDECRKLDLCNAGSQARRIQATNRSTAHSEDHAETLGLHRIFRPVLEPEDAGPYIPPTDEDERWWAEQNRDWHSEPDYPSEADWEEYGCWCDRIAAMEDLETRAGHDDEAERAWLAAFPGYDEACEADERRMMGYGL
jgi:hypothetical protein